ncbi:DUF4230 domain-containing protein [Sinomonas atrocyanea]|uniref:DUF4230 domain-containing protein n=1 Tax=Sinomonas atrocyanea TaxID=37927 RepID=UPI0027D8E246|nr:DUF4230 domain-containing protein [Sinomonas atrocyanea]
MIARVLKITGLFVAGVLATVLAGVLAMNAFGVNPFHLGRTGRSQPALLKSIQNTSRYHAAVGNFETVVDVQDGGMPGALGVVAGRRTLFVAAGTVDAYVDLTGLKEGDLTLSADGKSVNVRLPKPQLDKPNLDHRRSYVFSQDRGVLDRIADALEPPQQSQFYSLAETKLTDAAEKSELRERAGENTKAMLKGMLTSLDLEATFLDDPSR